MGSSLFGKIKLPFSSKAVCCKVPSMGNVLSGDSGSVLHHRGSLEGLSVAL